MIDMDIPYGASMPIYKTCIICNQTKFRREFLRKKNDRKSKVVTYCSSCALLDNWEELLVQKQRFLQMKSIEEYDYDESRFSPNQRISLMSKEPFYIREITYNEAIKYLREKGAYVENSTTLMKIEKDRMKFYIANRDHYRCYFCGNYGEDKMRLIPKSKKGITSYQNCVCVCETCLKGSLVANFERIDENPYRFKGVHSIWRKPCTICHEVKMRDDFKRSSICKRCWYYRQNLKIHPTIRSGLLGKKITPIERLNIENVRNSIRFIMKTKALETDTALIPASSYAIQIKTGAFQELSWDKVSYDLAVLLVEEGFCKIVPYYPNILFTIYSQNYITFRKQILKRDNHICHYCGKKGDTIDHKVPISKGGLTSPRNCVTACADCNSDKADVVFATLMDDE